MQARVDQNLEFALQWGYQPWDDALPDPAAGNGGEGPTQHSGTNNQIAGVDEADFVKNDGAFIYVLANDELQILDAWPPEQAHRISSVAVEGTPKKMFVHGDRALIYSSLPLDDESPAGWGWGYGDCTYGYHCQFTGDGHPTKITVLDISDRTAPQLLEETWLSGSYVNARRIGNQVYTVISDPGAQFPALRYVPDVPLYDSSPQVIRAAYRALARQNREIIEAAPAEGWLPTVAHRTLSPTGQWVEREVMGDCQGFMASEGTDGSSLTSVLTTNIAALDTPTISTIVSRPGAVYASPSNLYMAVPETNVDPWMMWWMPDFSDDSQTVVHKFALNGEIATYRASGKVPGRALNQFSMDEHGGRLRIGTTSGFLPSPDVHSTLSVLKEVGNDLVTEGSITDIAPTEDIRSMRFDGPRAFMVTFKKTDPLFVFDLSTPHNPQVLSELKIPGFSTYMHMLSDRHLLTIGYDADDQGDFAWFTGVRLQVFDVSDPYAPELTHKEIIGTRGSSSEALTNHLAFTYFEPLGALGLPITVCEGTAGGPSYGTMTFSGLKVYDVSTSTGFSLHGEVEHPAGADINCSNWWTQSSSQVRRTIFMDDFVYSVADDLVKVNAMDDLGGDLAVVPLVP
jgi:hypothetical protein